MWNGRFCWYRENSKTYIGIQIYRITQFKDIKAHFHPSGIRHLTLNAMPNHIKNLALQDA